MDNMTDDETVATDSRNSDAEYQDLMARLNHAPTGAFTVSDIDWLIGQFRNHWWRIHKKRRHLVRAPFGEYDGKTTVERLRDLAKKAGV